MFSPTVPTTCVSCEPEVSSFEIITVPRIGAQVAAGIPDSVVPIPYPSSGRKYKQEIMKAFVQRATALPEIGNGKADSDRQPDSG